MSLDNEKECLMKIADNDSSAFNILFRHYYPKTVIFLSSIVHDENAAEDLAQDIFLKIWTSRTILPTIRNFGSWLYIMARNTALMQLRKKRPSISIEDLEIIINEFVEEHCGETMTRETIHKAVENMPPRRKEIYILSREQGLSNEEIAKKLHIEKKTVENHLNLALKEIRNILAILCFFI